MGDLGLIKARAKAKRLYRVYEAILAITNSLTISDKERMNAAYGQIENLDKSTLRKRLHELEREVTQLRKRFGVKATDSQLLDILEKTQIVPGRLLQVMKHHLGKLVSNYEEIFPSFAILPEHAYLYIDAGQYRQITGCIEWFAPEVTLYEDMCSLFNTLCEKRTIMMGSAPGKVLRKSVSSLARGTVVAAYNFLESYLSGVGIDHVLLNHDTLDSGTITFLTEWDKSKNRSKFVSLRDKTIKYPKEIKGLQHPPFQETNCQEIAFLLGDGKTIRDSIVHSSVLVKGGAVGPEAIAPLSHLTQESVENVVDSAISLVRKIDTLVVGDERRVSWLIAREPNGHFPDRVFT